jgi:hypothetical protein
VRVAASPAQPALAPSPVRISAPPAPPTLAPSPVRISAPPAPPALAHSPASHPAAAPTAPAQPSHRKAPARAAPAEPPAVAPGAVPAAGAAGGASRARARPAHLTQQQLDDDAEAAAFATALLAPAAGDAGDADASMALQDSLDDGEPQAGDGGDDAGADAAGATARAAELAAGAAAAVGDALASDLLREEAIAAARRAQLRAAFDLFDADGDGHITVRELEAVMKTLGKTSTAPERAAMVAEVDADGSGTVEFEEFIELMKGHL